MVGGFASCHLGHWEFSSPLDTLEKQTNNRAKLKAAILAVVKVTQKTIIFGFSHYALDGVAGKAYEWLRQPWCLSMGPVLNFDLWETLLLAIDSAQHVIRWAWSPSHQGIPGNERADALAEQGRRAHPFLLYPSPEKANLPSERSPPAPAKHCRPRPYTYDTDERLPIGGGFFQYPRPRKFGSSSDDAIVSVPNAVLASTLCCAGHSTAPGHTIA